MYRVPSAFPKPPSWKQRLVPVLLAMTISAAFGWTISAFLFSDNPFFWVTLAFYVPLMIEISSRRRKYVVRSAQSVIKDSLIVLAIILVSSILYNVRIISDTVVLASLYGGMVGGIVGFSGNLTHYLIVERLFARRS